MKKNRPWLLLDVSFLCHRAFYSTRDLQFGDMKTGVTFGLLQTVARLQDQFNTNKVVFCFDSKHSKRKELDSEYKANRKSNRDTWEEEKIEAWKDMQHQIKLLRLRYLEALGYQNIFIQKGYEADDVIASIIWKHWKKGTGGSKRFIIISSDKDLYQLLLSAKITQWDPNKKELMTNELVLKEHGISPTVWHLAKAIAGDSGDNVPGVPGVGMKTAIKSILGTTTEKTEAKIKKFKKRITLNQKLVELPFKDTKEFVLQKDCVTRDKWREFCDEFGFESIKNHPPISKQLSRTKMKRKEVKKKARYGYCQYCKKPLVKGEQQDCCNECIPF